MCVLAVDVGTSMIKTVVFADDGTELAVARQATVVQRPHPGWAEQNMMGVWNAVVFTVREVLSQIPDRVAMLTFTAQGDGCWLVDAKANPTGPAVLWSDGRATAIVERWRDAGVLEQAFRANGSLTFAGLPNAILAWFAEHDPDRLARSHAALYCGGWLFARLTGVLAIDESDASAPLLDLASRTYSPELQRLFEIGELSRLLPDVRGGNDRLAELSSEAAADLGLPAGLPVVMAPYDIASTAIGAGAVDIGQACTILGTTLCTEVIREAIDTSGEPAGLTIALDSGQVLRAFPTLAGTEVLRWAAAILDVDTPQQLGELAGTAEPGADGIVFMPYLSPAGERAPFLDSHARGTVHGLTLEHNREQLARAVFEGLSMVIRDCLSASGSTATELRVCGGGANSEFWCQMIADVADVPVVCSQDTEVGAKGSFLTGLVVTGKVDDLREATHRYVSERARFTPDPDNARLYAQQYRSFVAQRSITREAWQLQGATDD